MKQLTLLISILLITACAATPGKRFPHFHEKTQGSPEVNLILDVTVNQDLSGDDIGFDIKQNVEAVELVNTLLISEFESRGYKVNTTRAGSGLFHKLEGKKYVYSIDGKTTGELYQGLLNPTELEASSSTVFYKNLLWRASRIGTVNAKDPVFTQFEQQDIPACIKGLPTELLAVVKVSSYEVGMGKSIGMALTTGFLTAILTGGMVVSTFPSSKTTVEMAMMNSKTGEIIWHNTQVGNGFAGIKPTISKQLSPLPTTEGVLLASSNFDEEESEEWED